MTVKEHAVSVEPASGEYGTGFRWVCACGAKGNVHEDRDTAWRFGIAHNGMEMPVGREG